MHILIQNKTVQLKKCRVPGVEADSNETKVGEACEGTLLLIRKEVRRELSRCDWLKEEPVR